MARWRRRPWEWTATHGRRHPSLFLSLPRTIANRIGRATDGREWHRGLAERSQEKASHFLDATFAHPLRMCGRYAQHTGDSRRLCWSQLNSSKRPMHHPCSIHLYPSVARGATSVAPHICATCNVIQSSRHESQSGEREAHDLHMLTTCAPSPHPRPAHVPPSPAASRGAPRPPAARLLAIWRQPRLPHAGPRRPRQRAGSQ